MKVRLAFISGVLLASAVHAADAPEPKMLGIDPNFMGALSHPQCTQFMKVIAKSGIKIPASVLDPFIKRVMLDRLLGKRFVLYDKWGNAQNSFVVVKPSDRALPGNFLGRQLSNSNSLHVRFAYDLDSSGAPSTWRIRFGFNDNDTYNYEFPLSEELFKGVPVTPGFPADHSVELIDLESK